MLCHRIQSGVEWFCDIRRNRAGPICKLPNNRSPSRVRNGCQHVRELIHINHYTIRCNVFARDTLSPVYA